MIPALVTPYTTSEDFSSLRRAIHARILSSLGTSPVSYAPTSTRFEELERYTRHGLTHIKLRYHVFSDEWAKGILILPPDFDPVASYKAILTIHGTNGTDGKYGVIDPDHSPNRVYALELARRGYITFSPDQYGYGEDMLDAAHKAQFKHFYDRYPDWSLTARRMLGHIRALDVLDQLPYVAHTGYGAMGNSLGGYAVFYLTAFDDRIRASIPSTGISPHLTNVYRNITRTIPYVPLVEQATVKGGKSPWELNELLALCAPKAVLCLEPFNDPYNPYTAATIACIQSAWQVYNLLSVPDRLSMYIHGDGHDTVPMVRAFAYDWLARFL